MKKLSLILLLYIVQQANAITSFALYSYAIKEATGAADENSARLAAAIFPTIDFKGNATQIEKAKKNFHDKFGKSVETFAPVAAVVLPKDMPAEIKKHIEDKQYAEAFTAIVDGVGKQVVEKLKVDHKPQVQRAVQVLVDAAK